MAEDRNISPAISTDVLRLRATLELQKSLDQHVGKNRNRVLPFDNIAIRVRSARVQATQRLENCDANVEAKNDPH
jgi:hypothetical protein